MAKTYTVHGSINCLIEAESANEAIRLMIEALMSMENCEGILDWDGLNVEQAVETKEEDFQL